MERREQGDGEVRPVLLNVGPQTPPSTPSRGSACPVQVQASLRLTFALLFTELITRCGKQIVVCVSMRWVGNKATFTMINTDLLACSASFSIQ